MDSILATFLANPFVYLSMPLISGLVGFATNVLAIKMMFEPVDFIGRKPLLGWQGIIPRRAPKMAAISVETITRHLISQEEIFNRLDANKIASALEPALNDLVPDIVDDIMEQYQPRLWELTPTLVKRRVYHNVQREAPALIHDIMDQLKRNISQVYDLEDMVVTTLSDNKALLNQIFQEVGHSEFRFIGRSGFYFGVLFGVLQTGIWLFFQELWLLPAFGLLVGYATNVIALQMIFKPRDPIGVGPLSIQGLFIKRQSEVARDYGRLVANSVLTPANIIKGLLQGPHSDRFFSMITRHVQRVVDNQSSVAKPVVTLAVGTQTYRDIKQSAVNLLIERLPTTLQHIEKYADEALDLESTLSHRLQRLSPAKFEGMLRPAFEQDEWLLILVGAALGFCVGTAQLLFFL